MTVDDDPRGSDRIEDGFRSITASLLAARGDGSPSSASGGAALVDAGQTPVTLLTGFLGSGKTTVLRHLLGADHGLRLTAIVNDLGSVNVDAVTLGVSAGSGRSIERLELANGCACCLLNDDLGDVLAAAVTVEESPDALLVEASGAADPVAMATTVEASSSLRLDGIICVVDAEQWPMQLDRPALRETARRQIEAAHLVLLAKTDLVSIEAAAEVTRSIASIAPGRRVIPTVDGVVEPALLLGAALLGAGFRPPAQPHDLTFVTETVAVDAPLDLAKLGEWLETDHRLLRAKGWVTGTDGELYELQVVGRRWTLTRTDVARSPEVVMIADDRSAIEAASVALGA